jgi:hypothetical protein
MGGEPVAAAGIGTTVPPALRWVKDAPLFIDDVNLARFYDAIVRPAYREDAARTIRISKSVKEDLEKRFGGKAGLAVPSWLSFLVSGGAEVSGEVASTGSEANAEESTVTLEPISTPHRQLEQLTVFYLLQHPQRLLLGGLDSPLEWQSEGQSAQVPRALAFIDLPPGAKFFPMAAEFTKGEFVTFFDKLLAPSGERPPSGFSPYHPDYWAWFDKNFDPDGSMVQVERASTEYGRIEWIDFRVPLDNVVHTMHLHIAAGGAYSTGTFAYYLIRRAYGHGIRVVGTLKDGPDLNVLALYEK